MSLLPVGISGEEAGYQIERSLRFNSADSAYLNRTPGSAGNRKTWTWSGWVKRSILSSNQALFSASDGTQNNEFLVYFSTSDTITIQQTVGGTSSGQVSCVTAPIFRDVSAWYHFVLAVDTTQATSTNRLLLYINGIAQTFSSYSVGSSINTWVNNTNAHAIGKRADASLYLNGYLTEINFIDGSALDPTSFGEYNTDTGVWQPKAYTGSYGTNGFYLNFSDNSGTTSTTLGKDQAGSNNWTPNNFSVTAGAGNDSLVDTPTNYGTDTGVGGEVRGNYCTLNPLGNPVLSGMTFSNGNLTVTTSSARQHIIGTMALPTTGKWYWECNKGNSIAGYQAAGIALINTKITSSPSYNYPYNVWGYNDNGWKMENGVQTTGYTSSASTSDVWGFAFDADAGTLACYLNNTLLFTISSLTSEYIPYLGTETGCTPSINFGQRPFAYTAPFGFKALCTQNLPEPTIVDGGEYFNTILYTGTGSSNARTGVGFQPGFVWIKGRSGATDHGLYDAVRGVQKQLESNTTTAETTETTGLTAFGSDGFTVGALAQLNTSSATYVAWNWKANGAGVSNTAGTITSTVSANTDSGFSIVTYTGTGANATVGHGLGVAPSMVIFRNRSPGDDWATYHASIGNTGVVFLNLTNATQTLSTYFQNTSPSSTIITLGSQNRVNSSGNGMVAYCFAAIPGYSAISSFTGNGSADGPFIFTNHRPAFVLIKRTDTTSNWTILDFQREGYNVDNDPLYPNLTNAEGTTDLADLLSNGFKLRTTDASVNASGGTYIYMSLASNPFKYSLGR